MPEQWLHWEPITNLSKKRYKLDFFRCTPEEFKISLVDQDNSFKKLAISFEMFVDNYKRNKLSSIKNSLNKEEWTFFKVKHSSYVTWLMQESLEIPALDRFTHFSFIMTNAIIDVLAVREPIFEWIETGKK